MYRNKTICTLFSFPGEGTYMMSTTLNQIDAIAYVKRLHRNTDGYITFFRKEANTGEVKQYHYKLSQLNDELIREWVTYDSYVSLNSFFRPTRGNAHLRSLHNLYVDLDCYNANLTPEQVLMSLEQDYFEQSIPKPNTILYSGRGLGLIWHIQAVSGLALERWSIVQKAIYNELKCFGADPSITTDGARVFRLPSSINSKSNEIVRYDVIHDYEYDLKEIGREYFGIIPTPKPKEKAQKRPASHKKKRQTVYAGFNSFSLYQARLNDLETLIKLRDGAMRGHRERLLFLARYYALKITNNEQAAIQKIEHMNSLFDAPLKSSELLNATNSAVTYYKEGTGINISNTTLIEWFGITESEQVQLTTIIAKKEKRERDRVKKEKVRRGAGVKSRSQYNAKRARALIRNAKRIKLIKAIYPNYSVREIAARAGLSKSYVGDLIKRLNALDLSAVDKHEQVSVHVSSLVIESAVVGPECDYNSLSFTKRLLDYWSPN